MRDPPRCDREVFEKGVPVLSAYGAMWAMEQWVKDLAKRAEARLDWHYSGGIAQVLHLGDTESWNRVQFAIDENGPIHGGYIMRRHKYGEAGLFRSGVDQVPGGAIAVVHDP